MNVENAVDSHAHVFDPRYSFAPGTHYTPDLCQRGTATKFRNVLHAHGFTHGLLVGAVPYAEDNRAMLDAIAASQGKFKGIAIIRNPEVTDRHLAALADGGVIGARFNLMSFGVKEITVPGAERMLARFKEMGWYVQLHCHEDDLVEAAPILRKAGVRVMIDHFGRPNPERGIKQPGFQELLEFGKSGNAIVKLSGPFRCSIADYPYTDTDPFIAAAIEAYTLDNCVWGSDWPFVRMDERMDYGPPMIVLPRWLPDPKDRRKVLWDSPARLFGFK
jgi:predicted TIM-barrel fold metal-dependent hydrolase